MNKYIVPICDIEAGQVWIKTAMAKSNSDYQDKLMEELIDYYELDDTVSNYREFVELLDSKYNILIGEIQDIEEI